MKDNNKKLNDIEHTYDTEKIEKKNERHKI